MTPQEQTKAEIKEMFPKTFPRKAYESLEQCTDYDTFVRGCHRICKLKFYGGSMGICHYSVRHKSGETIVCQIDKPPRDYVEFERWCNDRLKIHQDFFADNAPLPDDKKMQDGDKYRVLIGYTDCHTKQLTIYTTLLTYRSDYSDMDWYPKEKKQ